MGKIINDILYTAITILTLLLIYSLVYLASSAWQVNSIFINWIISGIIIVTMIAFTCHIVYLKISQSLNIKLDDSEIIIISSNASLKRIFYIEYGRLFLTNKRIIFKRVAYPSFSPVEISLPYINSKVELTKIGGLYEGISIRSQESIFHFGLNKPEIWKTEIESMINQIEKVTTG